MRHRGRVVAVLSCRLPYARRSLISFVFLGSHPRCVEVLDDSRLSLSSLLFSSLQFYSIGLKKKTNFKRFASGSRLSR